LLALLATLPALDEDFPEIIDLPVKSEEFFDGKVSLFTGY
jgi:hypothetical protein